MPLITRHAFPLTGVNGERVNRSRCGLQRLVHFILPMFVVATTRCAILFDEINHMLLVRTWRNRVGLGAGAVFARGRRGYGAIPAAWGRLNVGRSLDLRLGLESLGSRSG